MDRVRIQGNSFVRGGAPFFYLGDTVWMAFSKLSVAEWREILAYRRSQRFTVMQISVLPILHDNTSDEVDLHPFKKVGNRYDYDSISSDYFEHAEKMLSEMVLQGLVPCLHLLWVDYVPGTWASNITEGSVMTWPQMERYIRYAVERFEKYKPIYSVTGDTRFESAEVVEIYRKAMALVRELAPEALQTMHLTPHANPPIELQPDFYSYQAGHMPREQDNNFKFAQDFWARGDGKPIVNSEPPYEGHGHGGEYGRFQAFDIRKALWLSLLSGASAGSGYGAHGMWMLYRDGQMFLNTAFSGKPFPWRSALMFPGAWEGAFAQLLYEQYNLFGMQPVECLQNAAAQIRAAEAPNGTILIYVPYGCDVCTTLAPEKYDLNGIDMEHKHYMRIDTSVSDDGKLILNMPAFNADMLYILKPRNAQKGMGNVEENDA